MNRRLSIIIELDILVELIHKWIVHMHILHGVCIFANPMLLAFYELQFLKYLLRKDIMYNRYFGFSESPFENNLDQRFLFAPRSPAGRTAFSWKPTHLLVAFCVSAAVWALLVIYGLQGGLGQEIQYFLHRLYPLTPAVAVHPPIPESAANAGMAAAAKKAVSPLSDPSIETQPGIVGSGSSRMTSGAPLIEDSAQ
jgi:hypothetical protein